MLRTTSARSCPREWQAFANLIGSLEGGQSMIIVSVMYPHTEGARFDLDYYVKKHMPMVASRGQDLGLQSYEVLRGIGAAGGGKPPYHVTAHLTVSSLQAFQSGMETHGKEIMGDIPNYTDIQPVIQFSETVS